ncbi:MAG: 16S rRNA (adenine(1518)-N(6)/adenine(1519)-N(6))-dimethyltransferase RsmA [Eubacterium sp.]|nr:16S rRNA (adenine(1518)-N(6)/adenine(1519)-N(6))-dimethyltransferase RsmA [Eubacterium sp.]
MLSNPRVTIDAIKKYNFTFQKKFGQNFLIDDHVIAKIIAAAEITKEDTVLEIGPGMGNLTQHLAENAGKVYAVEIDKKLIPILHETLSSYENVEIIEGDILKTDIGALTEGKKLKIVANLPYYITTPIIMSLLEGHVPAESITVMVQKEVAERMAAGPGTKDYGALSLAVQYYSEPYLAANVPPNCFIPRPAVGSAVIRMKIHEEPPVQVKDEKFMFKLIKASFGERRKTLQNGIYNFPELDITKEAVADALNSMGLDERIRGEKLTLEEFARLSDILGR